MPDDPVEFIECIRSVLGLRPLPPERGGQALFRFTLDGVRHSSADEWAALLGITRQAVIARRNTLDQRLAAGQPNAYELATASTKTLAKRLRPERRRALRYRRRTAA